ncbi:beta-xylosidase [bacterium]|nr:beta-xylosidase [bacterium]
MSELKRKTVKVFVDANRWQGIFSHNWNYIGYDEINYTHTPEGEEVLEKFMSFAEKHYYIRAHHLLCTGNCHGFYKWGSTNVYTEDEYGNPIYNWKIIDRIFDIYLRYNCKPFVEIGFMPQALTSYGGNSYFEYRQDGWRYPPKDYQKWYELVYNLVKHCIERYGIEEVKTWYWELWNEPDIDYYWKGTLEDFCKLYDYTESAIRSILPEAKIGGPATTGPFKGKKSAEWLDRFLDHCVNGTNYFTGSQGTRIDFISFHAKGAGYGFDVHYKKQLPSIKRLLSQVQLGLEIIDKYPALKGLECVLSEVDPDGWAAGGRFDNPNLNFRNTEYYPSYVVTAFTKLTELAERYNRDLKLLSWAFMFRGERCFEGTRAFVTQGIDKPILNLFRMFSFLGDKKLYFESSQKKDQLNFIDDYGASEEPEIYGIATMTGSKSIEILLYCHHDDWDIKDEYEIELEVVNMPFDISKVEVRHYRLDRDHSNAYAEWIRQGKPDYPTEGQRRAIKARESLELYEPMCNVSVFNKTFRKNFILPTHGISLIVISPAK